MAPARWTVVLVDDAAEVRALVRTQLRLSGQFDVVGEGGTGVEAVEFARRHRPALLLLDVSMPVMDGLEALPLIREASPATRVVMYSGFAEDILAGRARRLGAHAFLEKSTLLDGLAGQLTAMLADSPSVAPDSPAPPTAAVVAPTVAPVAEPDRSGVLNEHLERFGELFENAAIGMATMTLTGYVVRANAALAALLDRSVDDLIGFRYPGLAPETAQATLRPVVQNAGLGGPSVVQLEHDVITASGERRLLAAISPVRDSRGRELYLFLQVQDVSAQSAADEALRQSEERFRLLVAAVEDYAIFMLDPTGHVVSWNAGAARIKGYTAAEVIGAHFRLFYPPDQRASRHPEHELEIALRDGHYEEEGWRVRKNGRRFWASVVITAVRNSEGEHVGFAKVTRDVTERRDTMQERQAAAAALTTANAELEQANAQLAQAAADQSHFLAVTAHELRTPIAVLGGSALTLSQYWTELTEVERAEMLDAMSLSAHRVTRLLNDLLMASRLEAKALELNLEPVPLNQLIAASVVAIRLTHADVDVVFEPGPPVMVRADPERLAQVLDNLIQNAIAHGRPPVAVAVAAADGSVQIRVSDAGDVAQRLRPRLFERFVTGEARGGTGLGLFIARELARAQGGDAWYEPMPAGSCFVVSIPAQPK